MLEDCAVEGAGLADELARAGEERLRETGEHVRRAARGAATAREAIALADRTLLGSGCHDEPR